MELTNKQRKTMTQIATVRTSHAKVKIQKKAHSFLKKTFFDVKDYPVTSLATPSVHNSQPVIFHTKSL